MFDCLPVAAALASRTDGLGLPLLLRSEHPLEEGLRGGPRLGVPALRLHGSSAIRSQVQAAKS